MAFQSQSITGRRMNPNYSAQVAARAPSIHDLVAEQKRQEQIESQMQQEQTFNQENLNLGQATLANQTHQAERNRSQQRRQNRYSNALGGAGLLSNLYFSERANRASGGRGILSFSGAGNRSNENQGSPQQGGGGNNPAPSIVGPSSGGGSDPSANSQILNWGQNLITEGAGNAARNAGSQYLNQEGTLGNRVSNWGSNFLGNVAESVVDPVVSTARRAGSTVYNAGAGAVNWIGENLFGL